MKTIQIQLDKIDKTQIFVGKVHKYLNCTLHDNKDGKDQYGNDGFITQSISKEKREAGERGAIIGNWKEVVSNKPKSEGANVNINPTVADDDLPL
jgi:hypothetical protein